MPWPFFDTEGGGAGKELFDTPGRPTHTPSTAQGTGPAAGGWGGEGAGTAPGGGLDLSDTRRIRTQTGTGPLYGQFDTTALGQYAGGANDIAGHYSQQGAAAQGRAGEQMHNPFAQRERQANDYARLQQGQALGQLRNAAEGNAPSQAQMQMQQGVQSSLQAQMAAANSSRGGGANMALAQRQAAAGGSAMQSGLIGQQAALRAQEMAQARGAYMQGAGDLRTANQAAYGADQDAAFKQAGLNMGQRAQNDQYQQHYDQMGLSALQGQQSADVTNGQTAAGLSSSQAAQQASNVNAGIGAGAATLGALAAFSDINLKSDISTDSPAMGGIDRNNPYGNTGIIRQNPYAASAAPTGPTPLQQAGKSLGDWGTQMAFKSDERSKVGGRAAAEADAFLDSLHPSSYTYKDSADEPSMAPSGGRYLGIMAQDVEKSPTGQTIVQNTPHGKMIDGKPMISALSAGLGRINERQRELEAELQLHKVARGTPRGGVTQ